MRAIRAGAGVGGLISAVLCAALVATVTPSVRILPGIPGSFAAPDTPGAPVGIDPLDPNFIASVLGPDRAPQSRNAPSHAHGRAAPQPPADAGVVVAFTPAGANDHMTDAQPIPRAPYRDHTSTASASTDPGEPLACAGMHRTVWYSFVAPRDEFLVATSNGSDFDTALAVYGDDSTALACNDNAYDTHFSTRWSKVAVRAKRGGRYLFQAGAAAGADLGGSALVFTLDELPLAGDSTPASIESLPFDLQTATFGNGVDPGEPATPDGPAACADPSHTLEHTMWLRYTADEDAAIGVQAWAENDRSGVVVYEEQPLKALKCSMDTPALGPHATFHARRGTTYLVQFGGPESVVRILVARIPPPRNDDPAHADPLPIPFQGFVSIASATMSRSEPNACLHPAAAIWYRFTARRPTAVALAVFGAVVDSMFAVYEGPSPQRLHLLSCRDYSENPDLPQDAVKITPGHTYWFQIGGRAGGGDMLLLDVHFAARPLNDDLGAPQTLSSLPFAQHVSTFEATTELNEPVPDCARPVGTIWYRIAHAQSLPIAVRAYSDTTARRGQGVGFPALIAVYRHDHARLAQVACSSDHDPGDPNLPTVTFTPQPDAVYDVQVGGVEGAGATRGSLCVVASYASAAGADRAGACSADPQGPDADGVAPPTPSGMRDVHYTFDSSPDGFALRNPQPFSRILWDAAHGRMSLSEQRDDRQNQVMYRSLPQSLTDVRSFLVTARWRVTSQGNYQSLTPLYLGPAGTIDTRRGTGCISTGYYSRDSNLGMETAYQGWWTTPAGVSTETDVWLPTSTEYTLGIAYDARARALSVLVWTSRGVPVTRIRYAIGSSTFRFDEIGFGTQGTDPIGTYMQSGRLFALNEPRTNAWLDDVRVAYEAHP